MWKRAFHTSRFSQFLKKPQFDVKGVIRDLNEHQDSIVKRQIVNGSELLARLQCLRSQYEEANQLDKNIAQLQSKRKSLEQSLKKDKSLAKELVSGLKQCKLEFQELNSQVSTRREEIQDVLQNLPNLIHKSVPDESPEIFHWIRPKSSYDVDANRDHVQIMVNKGMVDFQTASNVTGNSWYYLIGKGAQLEHALVSFALNRASKAGFQFCIPPSIVRNEIIDACGFRPRDMNNEQQIYHLQDTNQGLIATAEIALAGYGANKVMDLSQGPIQLVGTSRSFRAEAGARGKDTRGLYRVHEFTKVELFCWSKPEDSDQILEKMRSLQIEIVDSLGLSAKVLNMPANDLGAPACQKFDIEAWMPGRGDFGEITSTSNCLDYQSRRMNTKYKDNDTGKFGYVHTLNGTAMAVPRVILAIVENGYNPVDDTIKIPECLREFMNGQAYI
ncbi:hypothetical protein ZYGR_0I02750 [Zygosaccharomyces rouxii]|uniref:serine--tRNA ligase n=1 Tax=Zygosaccharomyces rouxii TaxID=4956 RepID=A0A1Q2ZX15_ZYGRO|nr:hypothetical protein ZYGR_0I02750 [Zygosaccharomyces rouxii]